MYVPVDVKLKEKVNNVNLKKKVISQFSLLEIRELKGGYEMSKISGRGKKDHFQRAAILEVTSIT